jgi:hypothetical protein
MNAAQRADVLEPLIPRPPADVSPLRAAISTTVGQHWETFVQSSTIGRSLCATPQQSATARFIGEMYARACYSMLMLSADGPTVVHLPVRATSLMPLSRGVAIRLGGLLVSGLNRLAPQAVHRHLLLTSALMGTLDVVLDEVASSGESAVRRVASLMTKHAPSDMLPAELPIATLAQLIRRSESPWQSEYWETVLEPAVYEYCLAEALAVAGAPDPKGMGHRQAGIEAVIKGMWYVVGPYIGLDAGLSRFEPLTWNREQRWMADTTLLMQMIDDWVDQDEDDGARVTPVLAGVWNAQSVDGLYRKTVEDLFAMLAENGIRSRVLQELFVDLYNDYLHAALDAMRVGIAA